MQRNSILRPPCSPRSEEEASRQRNRLQIVQKSLLDFNRKLITEITATLEQTKDVEAAASSARLQHSADRLAGISEKLEALAYGTTIDGQHNEALESVEQAHRIIDSLQRRLNGRNGGPPQESFLENQDRKQRRPIDESKSTSESKGHGENNGTLDPQITSPSMGIAITVVRPQGSPNMVASLAPATSFAFLNYLFEDSQELRQTTLPPSLRPGYAMVLRSLYPLRRESHKVIQLPKSVSSEPKEDVVNEEDGPDSEGINDESDAAEVLATFPVDTRYGADCMQKDIRKREHEKLDAGGLLTKVETTTADNAQSSLTDRGDQDSEVCGWETSAHCGNPTTETKVQQLQPHDGSATRYELPKRALSDNSDHLTAIKHLRIGQRATVKCRISPGKRSKKDAAAIMMKSTITQATKRIRKLKKPGRRCGTLWKKLGGHCVRCTCKTSLKLHLKPVRILGYRKRYTSNSSLDVAIMEKHRSKVRRKAKCRRKRRPKIRKKRN